MTTPTTENRGNRSLDHPDWNELKLALNNAVWMHAPGTLTLAQAEEATCLAISYISKYHNAAID